MNNKKIKIAMLFGGRSGEHAVSLMSAKFILSQLKSEKYEVTQIGISRDGDWFVGERVLDNLIEEKFEELSSVTILPAPSQQGLFELKNCSLKFLRDFDLIFPVLHGTFGEDGTLQGLLEMADLAYVGSGVVGSAVGMDKAIFANVMEANAIPIVKTILVLRSEIKKDSMAVVQKLESELGEYPYFVKPANLGSSVGISKSKNSSDLIEGLMEAAQYDRRIVVQKGHQVREIEVSVMGNDEPLASLCGEVLPAEEFYSYEAKYHDDSSRTVIPAEISETLSEKIRALAIKAYKACDLAGLTRVDFFIDKETDEVYINELNTLPGFTEISMYPLLWEASGVSNQDLVDQLVDFALERKAQRDATKRTFRRNE